MMYCLKEELNCTKCIIKLMILLSGMMLVYFSLFNITFIVTIHLLDKPCILRNSCCFLKLILS